MKDRLQIKDIMNLLEELAPPKLAYHWDNVGLLVGERNAVVNRILLSLDITPSIVDHAVKKGFDLIITHHPLIFNPIKNVTEPMILKLIKNDIAVYTMHTNLDQIREGVSKALADRLGLTKTKFVEQSTEVYHIALYVPQEAASEVADAVHQAGAGIIGNYSHCLNSYSVMGQFKPLQNSEPAKGSRNKLEKLTETKLEFFVEKPLLENVIRVIHDTHPYETPAYAIYPQQQSSLNYGLGIIGELKKAVTLHDLALQTRKNLQAPFVKIWPAGESMQKKVRKVAVCGGSGSCLIDQVAGEADVFISADFTYHKILESKIPLIDAGHYYTEYPILEVLYQKLGKFHLDIEILDIERADITYLISL